MTKTEIEKRINELKLKRLELFEEFEGRYAKAFLIQERAILNSINDLAEELKKIEKAEKKQICSICGNEYAGWGNNAYPVNDGRCCNACNFNVVLPERVKKLSMKFNEEK